MNRAMLWIFITALAACKTATTTTSSDKQLTPFSSDDLVDLTRYRDANEETYTKMQVELANMKIDFKESMDFFNPKSVPKEIDKREAAVINLYTRSAYGEFNKALRSQDPSKLGALKNTILSLASGLNKLPTSPCTAKRGLNLPEKLLKYIEKNTRFVECAFMSTSIGSIPDSFDTRNTAFEIESEHCAKISKLSILPEEKEVLFPPGSEFLVTEKVVSGSPEDKKYLIKMKHILSDESLAVQTTRKVDCKFNPNSPENTPTDAPIAVLTTQDTGANSAETIHVTYDNFIGRIYKNSDKSFSLYVRTDGKAAISDGNSYQVCSGDLDASKKRLEFSCKSKTYYFSIISLRNLGLLENGTPNAAVITNLNELTP